MQGHPAAHLQGRVSVILSAFVLKEEPAHAWPIVPAWRENKRHRSGGVTSSRPGILTGAPEPPDFGSGLGFRVSRERRRRDGEYRRTVTGTAAPWMSGQAKAVPHPFRSTPERETSPQWRRRFPFGLARLVVRIPAVIVDVFKQQGPPAW